MTILAKEQGLNFEELYREEGELLAAVNAWILNFDVNNWLFDSQKNLINPLKAKYCDRKGRSEIGCEACKS